MRPSATALRGALLVAGTTSDAGKSALVAGICRWLARQGVSVAPFKAQNMSNNSVVTADGGEIGRAQAMQAHACGLEPSVAFNPVLLKPGSDRSSQVVVLGRAQGTVSAMSYRERKAALLEVVTATLADLRSRYDVVVCEGAGSPAEINLRATDIANMGLAQAADLPVVVVGDIDRGGVLAHLFGTVAVLSPADQARIAGFVVNKFRGDPALLAPGLDQLRALTGRPTLGVRAVGRRTVARRRRLARGGHGRGAGPAGARARGAVAAGGGGPVPAHLQRDGRRGAGVRTGGRGAVRDRAVPDRGRGPRRAARLQGDRGGPGVAAAHGLGRRGRRAREGRAAGAGDLRRLPDARAGDRGSARGRGRVGATASACSTSTSSSRPTRCWRTRRAPRGGTRCAGTRSTTAGWCARETRCFSTGEGSDAGAVLGTHWHGLLENDGFRRALLVRVAEQAGRTGFRVAPDTSFAAERAAQLDLLGDLVADHLDTAALRHVIGHGTPPDLPTVTSGLAGSP